MSGSGPDWVYVPKKIEGVFAFFNHLRLFSNSMDFSRCTSCETFTSRASSPAVLQWLVVNGIFQKDMYRSERSKQVIYQWYLLAPELLRLSTYIYIHIENNIIIRYHKYLEVSPPPPTTISGWRYSHCVGGGLQSESKYDMRMFSCTCSRTWYNIYMHVYVYQYTHVSAFAYV